MAARSSMNGSTASGTTCPVAALSTTSGEPQNWQLDATSLVSVRAAHRWHTRVYAPIVPTGLRGKLPSSANAISRTCRSPWVISWVNPQYGHCMALVPGANWTRAPHPPQGYVWDAAVGTSVIGSSLRGQGWRHGTEQPGQLRHLARRHPPGHAVAPHQRVRGQRATRDLLAESIAVERPQLLPVGTHEPLLRLRQRRRTHLLGLLLLVHRR